MIYPVNNVILDISYESQQETNNGYILNINDPINNIRLSTLDGCSRSSQTLSSTNQKQRETINKLLKLLINTSNEICNI